MQYLEKNESLYQCVLDDFKKANVFRGQWEMDIFALASEIMPDYPSKIAWDAAHTVQI